MKQTENSRNEVVAKIIPSGYEKEYSKLDVDWNSIDKVTQTRGYEVYKDLKIDEQIKFCLFIKKILIIGRDIEIKADNDEIKNFITENIESLEPSFFTTMWNIATAVDYGFSVSEILWDRKKDGKIWLKGLKTIPPWTVEFEYNEFGHLTKMTINYEEMPLNKFLIISYFSEFGNLKGFPELASAWNPYFFKKMTQKFWLKHLERFGSPIAKGYYPKGASDEEVEKFFQNVNRIYFQAGILLPRSRDKAEDFDIEFVESKREGGSQFYDAMEYSDNRIAKAFLLPNLFGASSIRFGSYALAEKQFEVFYRVTNILQSNIEQALNNKVIKPLIQYNFPNGSAKVNFKPYSLQEAIEIIKSAVQEIEKAKEISDEHREIP
ncbi:MAG TPA: DUF935 family protein [bacterium]|nr:DUF935 family protein [bacterium]